MCGFTGKLTDISRLESGHKEKLEEFLKERQADLEKRLKLVKEDLAKLKKR
jgi:hypothetical protein